MANEASSIDLTELLKKMDSQNEALEQIKGELSKSNERADRLEEEAKKKESEEKQAEEANANSRKLTDESILKDLDTIITSSNEQDKKLNASIDDILLVLKEANVSANESKEELKKIVNIESISSKTSKDQADLVATYALVLVPVFIALVFFYRFFKQFI